MCDNSNANPLEIMTLMNLGMARCAECNQVFLAIVAGQAAKFLVVNLEIGHGSAGLASPAISTQYLVAEIFV